MADFDIGPIVSGVTGILGVGIVGSLGLGMMGMLRDQYYYQSRRPYYDRPYQRTVPVRHKHYVTQEHAVTQERPVTRHRPVTIRQRPRAQTGWYFDPYGGRY